MAALKIEPNTYLLFIDPLGGTSYDEVVCLTNVGFAGSTAINDNSSFCGPDSSPGNLTSTVAVAGQIMLDPESGEITAPSLFTLWQTKASFGWKIGPAVPAAGDIVKSGNGFFSAYNEDYPNGNIGVFNATISVQGDITQTVTPPAGS